MIERGLVRPDQLWSYLEAIEPQLFRFPAIDPPSLRAALEQAAGPAT